MPPYTKEVVSEKYLIGFDVGGGSIRAGLYRQSANGRLEKLPLPDQGSLSMLDNPDYDGIIIKEGIVKKRFNKGKEAILKDISGIVRHIQSAAGEPIAAIGVALPCRFESAGAQPTDEFEDISYVVQQRNSGMDMANPPSECWGTNWAEAITEATGIKTFPLNDANMAMLAHWQSALAADAVRPSDIGWGLYVGAGTGFGVSTGQFSARSANHRIVHNAHMYDAMLPLDSKDQPLLADICAKAGVTIVEHALQDIHPEVIVAEQFPKQVDNKPVFHLIRDGEKTYALAFQLFAASSIQTLAGGENLKEMLECNEFNGHGETLDLIGKYLGRFTRLMHENKLVRVPSEGSSPLPQILGDMKWVFMGGGAFMGELGKRIKEAAAQENPHPAFLRATEQALDVCAASAQEASIYLQRQSGQTMG